MKLASGPRRAAPRWRPRDPRRAAASVAWAALGRDRGGPRPCACVARRRGRRVRPRRRAVRRLLRRPGRRAACRPRRRAVRLLRRARPGRPGVGGRAALLAAACAVAAAAAAPRADHGGVAGDRARRRAARARRCSASALLALAREVGMLRLAIDPRGALEIAHEGPEIGGAHRARRALRPSSRAGRIGLAVFTSEGCHMCRALAPAIAAFGRDPRVSCARSTRSRDADAWAAADVPGQPVRGRRSDADGTVLAKGTFNPARSWSRVLAAAERRRGCRAVPERRRAPQRPASRPARRGAASSRAWARGVMALAGAGPPPRWSSRARPRPTTSAGTSTRPTPARTRPGCRGSTRAGYPLRAKDGQPRRRPRAARGPRRATRSTTTASR